MIEFKTTQAEEFVRVHGSDNIKGSWLMKAEEIKGLNAEQIQRKFNLPHPPTSISKVNPPIGTKIRMGIVGPNKFGVEMGTVQFQILEELDKDWFTKIGDL